MELLLYKISYLTVAIGGTFIVLFVIFKRALSKFNIFYSLLNLSMIIWALGRYALLVVESYDVALIWVRILYIGSILVHVFFLHSILIFLGKEKMKKLILMVVYLNAVILLFVNFIDLFVGTNFFIQKLTPKIHFSYYENPNTFYHLHLIINYLFVTTYAFVEMVLSYVKRKEGAFRSQLKILMFSSFLGFVGGNSVVPLIYNIDFLTIFVILVPLHLFTMAYAVLRYRLMDIGVVIRSGAVTVTALFILILISTPSVLIIADLVDYEINYFVFWTAVSIFSGCVLVFIPLKKSIEETFNKYFFAALYTKEKILKDLISEIPKTLNLDELTDLVIDTTRNALQIEKISLWSIDAEDEDYIPLKKIGFKAGSKKDIVSNRIVAKYFSRYHEPIIYQEIDKLINDPELITPERTFEKLKKTMSTQEIEIIFPLVLKKELVGMMFLGQKIDGASYSDQDIDVLKTIADQSAVALENANLYKETQRFAEKMKKEVKKATAKLRKINKQLTKLDKAKSEFISIASHQLRTPITAIKGYTSMVLEGDYGKVNKTLMPAIERIFKSSNRMNALVESLLNISRIESGKVTYDFKEVNFSEMAKNITNEFDSAVKEKGLELVCSCPKKLPMVTADEVKIREVISNLIDNAIKYTDKGKIEVGAKINDGNNKSIIFYVKDSGMGIAEEDLSNVFQKFRRGKKVALVHTEGLGLGMYFAQKTVEAHKGEIWVESPGVGKGSTFYVRLPV